jgi:hypothetical protein
VPDVIFFEGKKVLSVDWRIANNHHVLRSMSKYSLRIAEKKNHPSIAGRYVQCSWQKLDTALTLGGDMVCVVMI